MITCHSESGGLLESEALVLVSFHELGSHTSGAGGDHGLSSGQETQGLLNIVSAPLQGISFQKLHTHLCTLDLEVNG